MTGDVSSIAAGLDSFEKGLILQDAPDISTMPALQVKRLVYDLGLFTYFRTADGSRHSLGINSIGLAVREYLKKEAK